MTALAPDPRVRTVTGTQKSKTGVTGVGNSKQRKNRKLKSQSQSHSQQQKSQVAAVVAAAFGDIDDDDDEDDSVSHSSNDGSHGSGSDDSRQNASTPLDDEDSTVMLPSGSAALWSQPGQSLLTHATKALTLQQQSNSNVATSLNSSSVVSGSNAGRCVIATPQFGTIAAASVALVPFVRRAKAKEVATQVSHSHQRLSTPADLSIPSASVKKTSVVTTTTTVTATATTVATTELALLALSARAQVTTALAAGANAADAWLAATATALVEAQWLPRSLLNAQPSPQSSYATNEHPMSALLRALRTKVKPPRHNNNDNHKTSSSANAAKTATVNDDDDAIASASVLSPSSSKGAASEFGTYPQPQWAWDTYKGDDDPLDSAQPVRTAAQEAQRRAFPCGRLRLRRHTGAQSRSEAQFVKSQPQSHAQSAAGVDGSSESERKEDDIQSASANASSNDVGDACFDSDIDDDDAFILNITNKANTNKRVTTFGDDLSPFGEDVSTLSTPYVDSDPYSAGYLDHIEALTSLLDSGHALASTAARLLTLTPSKYPLSPRKCSSARRLAAFLVARYCFCDRCCAQLGLSFVLPDSGPVPTGATLTGVGARSVQVITTTTQNTTAFTNATSSLSSARAGASAMSDDSAVSASMSAGATPLDSVRVTVSRRVRRTASAPPIAGFAVTDYAANSIVLPLPTPRLAPLPIAGSAVTSTNNNSGSNNNSSGYSVSSNNPDAMTANVNGGALTEVTALRGTTDGLALMIPHGHHHSRNASGGGGGVGTGGAHGHSGSSFSAPEKGSLRSLASSRRSSLSNSTTNNSNNNSSANAPEVQSAVPQLQLQLLSPVLVRAQAAKMMSMLRLAHSLPFIVTNYANNNKARLRSQQQQRLRQQAFCLSLSQAQASSVLPLWQPMPASNGFIVLAPPESVELTFSNDSSFCSDPASNGYDGKRSRTRASASSAGSSSSSSGVASASDRKQQLRRQKQQERRQKQQQQRLLLQSLLGDEGQGAAKISQLSFANAVINGTIDISHEDQGVAYQAGNENKSDEEQKVKPPSGVNTANDCELCDCGSCHSFNNNSADSGSSASANAMSDDVVVVTRTCTDACKYPLDSDLVALDTLYLPLSNTSNDNESITTLNTLLRNTSSSNASSLSPHSDNVAAASTALSAALHSAAAPVPAAAALLTVTHSLSSLCTLASTFAAAADLWCCDDPAIDAAAAALVSTSFAIQSIGNVHGTLGVASIYDTPRTPLHLSRHDTFLFPGLAEIGLGSASAAAAVAAAAAQATSASSINARTSSRNAHNNANDGNDKDDDPLDENAATSANARVFDSPVVVAVTTTAATPSFTPINAAAANIATNIATTSSAAAANAPLNDLAASSSGSGSDAGASGGVGAGSSTTGTTANSILYTVADLVLMCYAEAAASLRDLEQASLLRQLHLASALPPAAWQVESAAAARALGDMRAEATSQDYAIAVRESAARRDLEALKVTFHLVLQATHSLAPHSTAYSSLARALTRLPPVVIQSGLIRCRALAQYQLLSPPIPLPGLGGNGGCRFYAAYEGRVFVIEKLANALKQLPLLTNASGINALSGGEFANGNSFAETDAAVKTEAGDASAASEEQQSPSAQALNQSQNLGGLGSQSPSTLSPTASNNSGAGSGSGSGLTAHSAIDGSAAANGEESGFTLPSSALQQLSNVLCMRILPLGQQSTLVAASRVATSSASWGAPASSSTVRSNFADFNIAPIPVPSRPQIPVAVSISLAGTNNSGGGGSLGQSGMGPCSAAASAAAGSMAAATAAIAAGSSAAASSLLLDNPPAPVVIVPHHVFADGDDIFIATQTPPLGTLDALLLSRAVAPMSARLTFDPLAVEDYDYGFDVESNDNDGDDENADNNAKHANVAAASSRNNSGKRTGSGYSYDKNKTGYNVFIMQNSHSSSSSSRDKTVSAGVAKQRSAMSSHLRLLPPFALPRGIAPQLRTSRAPAHLLRLLFHRLLTALASLHRAGASHGNLHPGAVALIPPRLSALVQVRSQIIHSTSPDININ